jgi:hypothetical protein
MYGLIIGIFVVGYLAIAFEHPIKINKTASASYYRSTLLDSICAADT